MPESLLIGSNLNTLDQIHILILKEMSHSICISFFLTGCYIIDSRINSYSHY